MLWATKLLPVVVTGQMITMTTDIEDTKCATHFRSSSFMFFLVLFQIRFQCFTLTCVRMFWLLIGILAFIEHWQIKLLARLADLKLSTEKIVNFIDQKIKSLLYFDAYWNHLNKFIHSILKLLVVFLLFAVKCTWSSIKLSYSFFN